MTNRQFVISVYKNACWEFCSTPCTDYGNTELRKYTLRGKNEYYQIREEYPFGRVLSKAITVRLAWKNAKNKIKEEQSENKIGGKSK